MQSIFPSSEIRKSSTYSSANDVQDVPSTSEKLEGKFYPDISLGGMESGPTDSRSTAEVSSEVASNITSSASDSDSSSLIQTTSTPIPNTYTVHSGNQTSSGILGPGSTVSSGSISSLEVNKNLQRLVIDIQFKNCAVYHTLHKIHCESAFTFLIIHCEV